MRARLLALASVLTLAACAAPVEEDAGESAGAATALDTSMSESEAAALRGEGLTGCTEDVGNATLCVHPRGLVVMSDDGIALLRADGETITAKALAAETRQDVTEVLGAAEEPESTTKATSLHFNGVGSQVAVKLFGALADRFAASSAKKASVQVAEKEAQVAAVHSPSLADELADFSAALMKGETFELTGRGVSILGGTSRSRLGLNFFRWQRVTKRRTFGISTPVGRSARPATIQRFFETELPKEAAIARREGERLTLMIWDGQASQTEIIRQARAANVDVILLTNGAPPQQIADGVVAVLRAPADEPFGDASLITALARNRYELAGDDITHVPW